MHWAAGLSLSPDRITHMLILQEAIVELKVILICCALGMAACCAVYISELMDD